MIKKNHLIRLGVSAISDVTIELIQLLLTQVKGWIKRTELKDALKASFTAILTPAENEPFFNELSKLIKADIFKKQLLQHSADMPLKSKSIEEHCRDIAAVCSKNHMYGTQIYGIVH